MSFIQDSNKTYNDDQTEVADIINSGNGVQASLVVGTSPVEAKVGALKLAGRKFLGIHNSSNTTVYWGWTNSVTSSSGFPIFKDQTLFLDIGDIQTVYLIAASAGNTVRVSEA